MDALGGYGVPISIEKLIIHMIFITGQSTIRVTYLATLQIRARSGEHFGFSWRQRLRADIDACLAHNGEHVVTLDQALAFVGGCRIPLFQVHRTEHARPALYGTP